MVKFWNRKTTTNLLSTILTSVYLHGTARLIRHSPVSLSGGTKLTNGGSSNQLTFRLNFSGIPIGGTGEFSGHVISLISIPSSVHVPILSQMAILFKFIISNSTYLSVPSRLNSTDGLPDLLLIVTLRRKLFEMQKKINQLIQMIQVNKKEKHTKIIVHPLSI